VAQQFCTSPSVGSNIQVNLSNSQDVGYRAQYYLNVVGLSQVWNIATMAQVSTVMITEFVTGLR
jgi:hypothetical protein